ncbi:MAG: hypothetical protein AAF658_09845, partial [Myxococcota bacterium]
PVRSGTTISGTTVSLASNACRSTGFFDAGLGLTVTNRMDGQIVPSVVQVVDAGPHSFDIGIVSSAAMTESFEVQVSSANSAVSFSLPVAPPINFGGIRSALVQPDGSVSLAWAAATGGTSAVDYRYTVFESDIAGVLGTAVANDLTTTTATVDLSGLSAGLARFYTVRVRDGLDDGADTNEVQASIVTGPVRYVDSRNTNSSPDGSASNPYLTIADGITDGGVSAAVGTVYVGVGSAAYAELGTLDVPDSVQLIGGFDGFMNGGSTTATDWVLGQALTSLDFENAGGTSPALTLGNGSRLDGFSIAAEFSSSGDFVTVNSGARAELRNASITSTSGRAIFVNSAQLQLSNVTVQNNECVGLQGASVVELDNSILENCQSGAVSVVDGGTVTVANDSLLRNSNTSCISASGSGSPSVNVDGSVLENCGESAVDATVGEVIVRNSTIRASLTGRQECVRAVDVNSVSVTNTECLGFIYAENTSATPSWNAEFVRNRLTHPDAYGAAPVLVVNGNIAEDHTLAIVGNEIIGGRRGLSVNMSEAVSVPVSAQVNVSENVITPASGMEVPASLYLYAPTGANGRAVDLQLVNNTILGTGECCTGGLYAGVTTSAGQLINATQNTVSGFYGREVNDAVMRLVGDASGVGDTEMRVVGNQVVNNPATQRRDTDPAYAAGILAQASGDRATLLARANTVRALGVYSSNGYGGGDGLDVSASGVRSTMLSVVDNTISRATGKCIDAGANTLNSL